MTKYNKHVLGRFLAGVGIVAMVWGFIWGIFIRSFFIMWAIGVIFCKISCELLDNE